MSLEDEIKSSIKDIEQKKQTGEKPKDSRHPSVQVPVDTNSDEFLNYISTEVGFVTTLFNPTPKDDEDEFEWLKYQIRILQSTGDTITNKCRQSGGSYVYAAKAAARGNLINKDYAIIFTSIKRDEAQNKINYVKEFLHSMPIRFRRKILYETKQSIEFMNSDRTTCRIISHSQRPARGEHGDNTYDEVEFYNDFQSLFQAGAPGTRKVNGQINIISTPFDPFGFFRRIIDPAGYYGTQDHPIEFQSFKRFLIVWWVVPFYCNNIPEAMKYSTHMSLRERVYKFGTNTLIKAYETSASDDDFQQEYEAKFIEKISNFFQVGEIKQCLIRDMDDIFEEDYSLHRNRVDIDLDQVEEDKTGFMFESERELIKAGISPKRYGNPTDEYSIDELFNAYQSGLVSPRLYLGVDVATSGDATDILIKEEVILNGKSFLIPRFWLNKNNWDIPDQQEYIDKKIMSRLPIVKAGMDTHGLGMQMGQFFQQKYPSNFVSMPMVVSNQNNIMSSLKARLQSKATGIVAYQEVIKGFNSVKRKTTKNNTSVWELARKNKGHSDFVISEGICCYLADQFSLIASPHSGSSRPSQDLSDIRQRGGVAIPGELADNGISDEQALRNRTRLKETNRRLKKKGLGLSRRALSEIDI